mgnify:CR=1 FL=1|jgi:pimeloyl-ACP methyl ester carboxylesterase
MRKMTLTAVIVAISAFFLMTLIMPAKIGRAVYDSAAELEAGVYGLETKYTDIGEMNISLYQNELSDRPTVLMLHGYSADKNVWPRFARYFTDDYNVLIPDMAGHGLTGFDAEWSYTGPAQVERLIKLLDKLGIQQVHIIGNSMGGFISAHFARMYPLRTLSAALVDPAGVASPQPSTMGNMLAKGQNPFEIHNREDFDTFYNMTMAEPPWFPDFILEAVSEKYQHRRAQLAQIFGDFHGRDPLDNLLHEITVPALLLWGAKDQLIHVSSVDVWQQGIKQIQVKVWPDIGHMPMLEVPEDSARVYQQFITQIN